MEIRIATPTTSPRTFVSGPAEIGQPHKRHKPHNAKPGEEIADRQRYAERSCADAELLGC
jgi:hypothetical protein